LSGPAEHIVGELVAPGVFGDHPDIEVIKRVGTGIGHDVAYVHFFFPEIGTDLAPQLVKFLRVEGFVHFTPMYFAAGDVVIDDKTVLRGAAGEFAGVDD
jgi:hypothetical protein